MRTIFFLSFAFLLSLTIKAQNISVHGKVIDKETSASLPEVTIAEKAKPSNSVVTNAGGEFNIVVSSKSVLLVSSVGYKKIEIKASSNEMAIQLEKDISGLDEVVVIGYGSRSKRDLTSSIATVAAKDIEKSPQLSPQFALQGKAPGVFVTSPTSDPNQRPTVRIRGTGTLGFNDPLYVIDGIPITEYGSGAVGSSASGQDLRGTQNILNMINPSDIESISVLKDATATSIYGLRASNGVILIETKSGKKGGKTTVSFNTELGIASQHKRFDVLSTKDYVSLIQESYLNEYAGSTLDQLLADGTISPVYVPSSSSYLGNSPFYDWQDAMIKKSAITNNNNISLTGGNNISNFYLSLNYSEQQSTIKFNKNKRYSLSFNSDHQLTPWLKIGETFRGAYLDGDDSRNSTGSDFNLWSMAAFPAFQPIYDKNHPLGFAPIKDPSGSFLYGEQTQSNPLALGTYDWQRYQFVRTLGNVYAQLEPVAGLRIKGTISADWFYQFRRGVGSARTEIFDATNTYPVGSIFTLTNTQNFNFVREVLAEYRKSFNEHNFTLLVSSIAQKYTSRLFRGSAQGIRYDDQDRAVNLVAVQGGSSSAEEFRSEDKLLGYLGRLSYNYNSKYYIDASLRRDGTSRFSPEGDRRWGNFYAVSGAWRISSEKFMSGIKLFNDLKIRGGVGETGNQETQPFGYINVINVNPRYPLGTSQDRGVGGASDGYANPDVTWETTTTTNIGVDAALLDYRLNITVEYYKRLTKGILQDVPLPITSGIIGAAVVNLGEVQNTGVEFSVNWSDKLGDFQYNIGANVSTNRNRVLKLFDNDLYYGSLANSIKTGYPINFLYGYKTGGIFRSAQEVSDYLAKVDRPGVESVLGPGDIRYLDLYGPPAGSVKSGPDGVLDFNDYEYLGKTFPGVIYGLNLGANYKGFDIYIQLNGQADVQKYNIARSSGESMSSNGANQWATTLNRWSSANPNGNLPRALHGDAVGNTFFSDRWVENASFARLQNLQIGYSFSEILKNKLGKIKKARLYVSASNLFLITKWSGIDPENDLNPSPRILSAGLNVNF